MAEGASNGGIKSIVPCMLLWWAGGIGRRSLVCTPRLWRFMQCSRSGIGVVHEWGGSSPSARHTYLSYMTDCFKAGPVWVLIPRVTRYVHDNVCLAHLCLVTLIGAST